MDLRLVTEGYGIMTLMPDGVAAAIYEMGSLQLLQRCDLDILLDFLAYYRSREIDWSRAVVNGGIPDPYLLFELRTGHPSDLLPYVRCKRRSYVE